MSHVAKIWELLGLNMICIAITLS